MSSVYHTKLAGYVPSPRLYLVYSESQFAGVSCPGGWPSEPFQRRGLVIVLVDPANIPRPRTDTGHFAQRPTMEREQLLAALEALPETDEEKAAAAEFLTP